MGLEADKVVCQVSTAQEQWGSCPEAALKGPDKCRNIPRINGELVSYLQNKASMGDRTHNQSLWLRTSVTLPTRSQSAKVEGV